MTELKEVRPGGSTGRTEAGKSISKEGTPIVNAGGALDNDDWEPPKKPLVGEARAGVSVPPRRLGPPFKPPLGRSLWFPSPT
jgi:hypothetical protein